MSRATDTERRRWNGIVRDSPDIVCRFVVCNFIVIATEWEGRERRRLCPGCEHAPRQVRTKCEVLPSRVAQLLLFERSVTAGAGDLDELAARKYLWIVLKPSSSDPPACAR